MRVGDAWDQEAWVRMLGPCVSELEQMFEGAGWMDSWEERDRGNGERSFSLSKITRF